MHHNGAWSAEGACPSPAKSPTVQQSRCCAADRTQMRSCRGRTCGWLPLCTRIGVPAGEGPKARRGAGQQQAYLKDCEGCRRKATGVPAKAAIPRTAVGLLAEVRDSRAKLEARTALDAIAVAIVAMLMPPFFYFVTNTPLLETCSDSASPNPAWHIHLFDFSRHRSWTAI